MKEHIIINKDRTVVVPDSVRKIGIQYDHKVNTLTFDCPRYADDNQSIDMSRMAIYINFSRNDKTKGSVAATNIFVDPDDPEIIHFDFIITRSVTLVNGSIICLVCAKSTDAEGVEVNHWNSELFNKLSVGEGMEAEEELTEEEIDYITSLLQEINTTHAEVADMDTRVEDLEFNQEKQGTVSEVDLEVMTWTEGSYITGSGTIGSSSGYGISELVTLPKMSTLILDATGYQSNVAMIAKSDNTPLVTSVDGKTHYEYYTDEEIQVYISCKTTAAKSAKIVRNVAETLSDLERENSELKGDLDNVYRTELGDNIVNPNALTIGSLKQDGTVDLNATMYNVSDFIPIEPNTDYIFSIWKNGSIKTSRKYVALYNERKEYIEGTYQNVTSNNNVTFNTGSAVFVRVSSSYDNSKFLCKGNSVPTIFVEYSKTYINGLSFDDKSIPQSAVDFSSDFIESVNINEYNQNTDVGGFINGSGTISNGSNYKTTDFIKVKNRFQYDLTGRIRFIGFYSTQKVFSSRDESEAYNKTITASSDGFIRVSYYINDPLVSVTETFIGTATKKIEEGIALSNYQIEQAERAIGLNKGYGNILYGKKWAVCGDSFTNSGGTGTKIQSGKYTGKNYTYPWIIGNRNDMDIVQFFGGGRTLAFPENPGTFENSLTNPNATFYYQNIPSDVDYITIYLGINDRNHATGSSSDGEDTTGIIPLGTIDDTTVYTYLGAWNVVLTWLITNRPNAHIGMIVTNGIADADSYRQGQIAIAKKYGMPYIDMNGDDRTPAMLRTSNPNIPDTIKKALIEKWAVNSPSNEHPNDAAQLFESTFIENFLRSI